MPLKNIVLILTCSVKIKTIPPVLEKFRNQKLTNKSLIDYDLKISYLNAYFDVYPSC